VKNKNDMYTIIKQVMLNVLDLNLLLALTYAINGIIFPSLIIQANSLLYLIF